MKSISLYWNEHILTTKQVAKCEIFVIDDLVIPDIAISGGLDSLTISIELLGENEIFDNNWSIELRELSFNYLENST